MTTARHRLAAQPRVQLGHWPTPLQRADRLRSLVGGPPVWFKRDDCSGLAVGGNKTRKLEFLLGRALAEGADSVVTFGALQSNHARQTAAACAQLGLRCELILTRAVDRRDEHYRRSGNLLLDGVLGAHVHIVDDPDAAFERFAELFDAAGAVGRNLFGVVPGGSDATGVLGYVDATLELADQAAAADLDIGRIVVAASTAGTAAGLVVGAAIAGLDCTVDIACVYEPASETEVVLRGLVAAGADLLGCDHPPDDAWTITDATLGEGYGVPTGAAMAAIEVVARSEGILLDPVYTGKAFAHLLAQIAAGRLDQDRDVVFVHTGGSPGLFAYAPEFA
ncbi:MAG: 1-aminocyclopropane-carboxylate deaminase [Acidimicrobiales bacterium]|nr:1-aminocyclopropane-carboxylate deaminase [Acidimicrobiales bacterium]